MDRIATVLDRGAAEIAPGILSPRRRGSDIARKAEIVKSSLLRRGVSWQ